MSEIVLKRNEDFAAFFNGAYKNEYNNSFFTLKHTTNFPQRVFSIYHGSDAKNDTNHAYILAQNGLSTNINIIELVKKYDNERSVYRLCISEIKEIVLK